MSRKLVTIVTVSFLFFFLFMMTLSESMIASAHRHVVATNAATPQKGCRVQHIHLNGSLPSTVTCLDQTQNGNSPYIGTTGNCGSAPVTLLVPDDGDVVCFTGQGFANLNNFYLQCTAAHYWTCGTSWYQEATAYKLQGCATGTSSGSSPYPGYFAENANGNGLVRYFKLISNQANFVDIWNTGHGVKVGPGVRLFAYRGVAQRAVLE